MSAIRFNRIDLSDGASEILTVVRIDGEDELRIEICAGPEIGDDFVGLYDLDGDQLQLGNISWETVDAAEVPTDVIAAIESDWESGTSVMERIPASRSERSTANTIGGPTGARATRGSAPRLRECSTHGLGLRPSNRARAPSRGRYDAARWGYSLNVVRANSPDEARAFVRKDHDHPSVQYQIDCVSYTLTKGITMTTPTTIKIDNIEYIRADIAPKPTGTRAVVVVDRGWVFAGDIERKNGRITLNRAIWVFRWESIGFDGVLRDPKNAKVQLRKLDAPVDLPEASEIFCVPVADSWGL
jgi:hypothetical protein